MKPAPPQPAGGASEACVMRDWVAAAVEALHNSFLPPFWSRRRWLTRTSPVGATWKAIRRVWDALYLSFFVLLVRTPTSRPTEQSVRRLLSSPRQTMQPVTPLPDVLFKDCCHAFQSLTTHKKKTNPLRKVQLLLLHPAEFSFRRHLNVGGLLQKVASVCFWLLMMHLPTNPPGVEVMFWVF